MAPKRKRTAEDPAFTTTATRATRSSTRGKSSGNSEATLVDSGTQVDANASAQDPQPKKAKRMTTKATTKPAKNMASKATKSAGQIDAEGSIGSTVEQDALHASNVNASSNTSLGSSTKPAKVVKNTKSVPDSDSYSASQATALFDNYADSDAPSVIGPEGFERLCNDADIPLEGALPLVLAWQFGASEMAKISRGEWDTGTSQLKIASLSALSMLLHDLEDLLLLDKSPLKPATVSAQKKKPLPEPYNRVRYYQYASDKSKTFNELYIFCFMLAKPPQARNIDMETAAAFWSVLVLPRYPIMQDILDFVNEKGTYKGVNKDLWLMVLEFCRTIPPTLQDYEADGAWPTMLDEFVTWKKAKQSGDTLAASTKE